MTPNDFHAGLRADGYADAVVVERLAGYALDSHVHSFDARALITAGEITLTVDGVATRYGVGDVFRLPAGTAHLESAGPDGVTYLSGRREVAAS
ncbi:MAG: cupin domain-containing protein [Polaromonas sp.]|nr:cupin domain-containing protein [Polaromonas sp.]